MMNFLALIVGLLVTVPAVAEFQVPATPNPVNDYAHVLTTGGKERIAHALVTLKKDTGAQFGVVIVESLDGSTIEDASFRTATQWKLGSQDKDDGVLLFIAVKDRKFRIEVGKGLEGIMTDYHSKQVTISMKSSLRAGDYDGAVLAAVGTVSQTIKAHNQEITSKSGATTTETESSDNSVFFILLALFGLGGIISTFVVISRKREEDALREARRISRQPLTPEQSKMARLMHEDVAKRAKKDPGFPKEEKKSRSSDDDDDGFVSGVVVGSLLSNGGGSSGSDDSGGGSFGGGSSDSGSDWGGGGGDFGGGGSSDSF